MSDIEAAITELQDVFDFGDWSPECLEAARTVIAAAREKERHREWCLAALSDTTDAQRQLADERVAHAADVSKLAGEIADERRAREQAEAQVIRLALENARLCAALGEKP